MLLNIDIKNFILVEQLNLDFSTGLHVLTGETGAGKSIWVDAMKFALGDRADPSVIREGQSRCDISLTFDIRHIPEAQQWLEYHQFEAEKPSLECLIRRTIPIQGASRSTVNGIPCPLHLIREFSNFLVTIHGQHDQYSLLNSDGQLRIVDRFAKNEKYLQEIQVIFSEWQRLDKQIAAIKTSLTNRHAELELLKFQTLELEQLNLKESEWEQLSQLHRQMHHSNQWQNQLQKVTNLLTEHEQLAIMNQIYQANNLLTTIKLEDIRLTNAQNLLKDAAILLEEADSELNALSNAWPFDPEKLTAIEDRLNKIHDIARKHRVNPNDLFNVHQTLLHKMNQLENAEQELNNFENQQNNLLGKFKIVADQLTKSREKALKKLNKEVTSWMQQLGMQGGFLEIVLEKIEQPIHAQGLEKIRFLVSTNPGQTPQPIQKLASGGELSRLHLALQAISAEENNTPTLVFDEVDVGIGGSTAVVVGKLLRQLGEKTQVLCITHLPQVAAFGHHHYQVTKSIEKNNSTSKIKLLDSEQRVEELARMLGGTELTSKILDHAKEMLEKVI